MARTSSRAAIGELHGFGPDHVFVANGSNEVLQSLCLAYGGAGRTVAVFEPTYALHSHIARITGTGVAVGERSDDFSSTSTRWSACCATRRPRSPSSARPTTPPGWSSPSDVVEGVLAAAPGLVVVDEAYGQFAPWSPCGARSPTTRTGTWS